MNEDLQLLNALSTYLQKQLGVQQIGFREENHFLVHWQDKIFKVSVDEVNES